MPGEFTTEFFYDGGRLARLMWAMSRSFNSRAAFWPDIFNFV
jgi:hypothetical protein